MTQIVCLAGGLVLGGLFGAVAWKAITGEMDFSGLFSTKRSISENKGDNYFSPSRVQLATTTLITASYYLAQVVHDPTRFPVIPSAWLLGLGASHGIYLGSKAESVFSSIQNTTRRRRK